MKTLVLETLAPIIEQARSLDLTDPAAAEATLRAAFPWEGEVIQALQAAVRDGVAAGTIATRENGDLRYERLAKDLGGLSVDVVHMKGPGPGHTHPKGEIDLCFPVDETASFDGRGAGFTVYAPGSWHIPTVAGGAMDIVYLLPGGAIEFGPKP